MPFSQCPAKLGGYIGPFPLTLPKYLPAAALQVLGQYCLCSGEITAPSWPSSQGRRDGQRQRDTNLFSSYPSCSLSLKQVWDKQKVLGTCPPGRVSLTSHTGSHQHQNYLEPDLWHLRSFMSCSAGNEWLITMCHCC